MEGGQLVGRKHVGQFHLADRMVVSKPLNQADEFLVEKRPKKGKAQAIHFSPANAADSLGGAVEVAKNSPCILQEKSTRRGQGNRMGIAIEDFGSELFLQCLDVAGERRLG